MTTGIRTVRFLIEMYANNATMAIFSSMEFVSFKTHFVKLSIAFLELV
jgi:hypothetical protein